MKAGRARLLTWFLLAVLAPIAGCAVQHQNELAHALNVDRDSPSHRAEVAAGYIVHCPDVLSIELYRPTQWKGLCPVGPDGRITVLLGQPIRAEGQTPPEIARAIAQQTGATVDAVHVAVAEYKSQQIYLLGEIQGLQRAVPYHGPETVLELLQRAGGISPGAAPGNIQVVRANVADTAPPEVYQVDLDAIVHKKNFDSNIRLHPFDQIYIGQTRRHVLSLSVPPWLRPLFQSLCARGSELLFALTTHVERFSLCN